ALRTGRAHLTDAYAVVKNGELWLLNAHIGEYPPAAQFNHPPRRTRKLLLHRRQIARLIGQLKAKGLTLIPTRLYFKEGRAKCELALARGKQLFDKRESIKKREAGRELARALRPKR
ncbi:MAG: SsrA-binding protein SmpB, partial [Deltaproteobacteria bacterium]|nr:SsrA-binding protein SmpB [Deltaproteobacteria bacterium]